MPLIKPVSQPAYYLIKSASIDGMTELGQCTGVNNALTVITAEGETAFLAAAQSIGAYKPLPPAGTWINAGEIYGYNNGAVIIRQSHVRTADAPADIPALISVYRPTQTGALDWVANEPVMVGALRVYNSVTYRCLQAHTTQIDWTPPAAPALWAVNTVTPGAWAVGVAYKIGDVVTYSGSSYRCLQAHTSQAGWTPTAAATLWLKL